MTPTPIEVTQIRNFTSSADRTAATFTLVTRDGSEIVVTMPARCLDTFEPRDRATVAGTAGSGGNLSGSVADTRKGTLHRPKKWLLGTEATRQKIVALVFDPQTEREVGFALSPKAAKDLAAGLVNNANAVTAYKPPTLN
jgi:hypothetical protein